ncbi:MAG: 50S ribosomal protein L11 methyltransferase [Alphaproteobacteria bacterium]|nr:50S ribosomal protein L11 methyltransferase [Alphaproteobacteria bacterium]
MYTARLYCPGALSESEIERLFDSEGADVLAGSVLREDGKDGDRWVLEYLTAGEPDLAALGHHLSAHALLHDISFETPASADWQVSAVPDIDWLERSYRQFPAFSVGPFYIYGSHHKDDIPPSQIGLQIDAARAFGSGEHGSTKGCLLALLDLHAQGVCPWNVVDMGAGSGILGIAAWKLWKTPVLAVDIDADSVEVALRHRDANRVPDGHTGMICIAGDGFLAPIVQEKKPFDLIIANILAGPLKDMAPDLRNVCDERGYVVLAGLLNEQATDVQAAYAAQGLTLCKSFEVGEWTTLLLQNRRDLP